MTDETTERGEPPADQEDATDSDDQPTDFVEGTFEASPHEPDPPSFDVTSGEDLVENLPSGDEVSADVRRSFWEMVVLIKIALLALSVGIMLAYFQGRFDLAAGLGLVAALAGVRVLLRIRSFDGE
ncbi:DUF7322 domain-containing protein [Salinarchaeum laminariae]|uniref:DUF7322 domain-containing protein n=1 Tax=Salinarchaeum laminariae TaxID=869888 RepID=UPI0020BFA318|nr:hypothetical protein [Salinarchaeum laminariae]